MNEFKQIIFSGPPINADDHPFIKEAKRRLDAKAKEMQDELQNQLFEESTPYKPPTRWKIFKSWLYDFIPYKWHRDKYKDWEDE